jgi:hypothetical protein
MKTSTQSNIERPAVTPSQIADRTPPSLCTYARRDYAHDFARAAVDVLTNWHEGNCAQAMQLLARTLGDYQQATGDFIEIPAGRNEGGAQ